MKDNTVPLTLISLLADGEFHSGEQLGETLGMSRAAINKTIYLCTYYSILSYYLQYLNYTLFIKCHPSANFYTAINFD